MWDTLLAELRNVISTGPAVVRALLPSAPSSLPSRPAADVRVRLTDEQFADLVRAADAKQPALGLRAASLAVAAAVIGASTGDADIKIDERVLASACKTGQPNLPPQPHVRKGPEQHQQQSSALCREARPPISGRCFHPILASTVGTRIRLGDVV